MHAWKLLPLLTLTTLATAEGSLFATRSPLELSLRAPFQEILRKGAEDEKFSAAGVLSYRDPSTGKEVVLPDVDISVRGHTSRRETECPFPKLRIKFRDKASREGSVFAGLEGVRIGTHCGDAAGEDLTNEFGRLANEKSPLRESFVYHLLAVFGIPTLEARLARITYADSGSGGAVIVRTAMLLEDENDATKRLGGTGEIAMERFTSARDQFSPADTARLAFAEAMIANFDWCLRQFPGDTYRCDAKLPLWNITAIERTNGPPLPVISDFDLAGTVVGRHNWFDKVYSAGFLTSASSIDIEVMSQVQRTRSLFTRAELDAARRYFMDRKASAYEAVSQSNLDPRGQELAQHHLDAFFADLEDAAFYRPVVVQPNVRVYADAAKSREACAAADAAPPGTPVNVVATDGEMAQVRVLDVHWRWAPPRECPPVRNGLVWIEKDAISAEYPAR